MTREKARMGLNTTARHDLVNSPGLTSDLIHLMRSFRWTVSLFGSQIDI